MPEPDSRGGLALAERGRRDRRDDDVLGLRAIGELVDRFQPDLGQLVAVGFEQMRPDAHLGGDVGERRQRRRPSDLEVGWKSHGSLLCQAESSGRMSGESSRSLVRGFRTTERVHDAEYYSISAMVLPPKTCIVGTTSMRVTSTCCGHRQGHADQGGDVGRLYRRGPRVQAGDGGVVTAERLVVQVGLHPAGSQHRDPHTWRRGGPSAVRRRRPAALPSSPSTRPCWQSGASPRSIR